MITSTMCCAKIVFCRISRFGDVHKQSVQFYSKINWNCTENLKVCHCKLLALVLPSSCLNEWFLLPS